LAKNLKINVKNTQLAEALQLGKIRKPIPKKKKAEESAKGEEAESATAAVPMEEKAAPATPPVKQVTQPAPPPPPEEKVETPLPSPPRPPVQQTPPARPSAPHQQYQQPSRYTPSPRQPSSYPPRQEGYPPRQGGGYPPRHEGPRPPRSPSPSGAPQSGAAPHYRKPGFVPPAGAGARPPYPPRRPYSPHGPAQDRGYRPAPSYRPSAVPPKEPPPTLEENREKKGGKTHFEEAGKSAPRKPGAQKEFREYKPAKKQEEQRSFDSRDRQGLRDSLEDQTWRKRRPAHKMRPLQQEEIIRPKSLKVRIPITVKDLAAEMKLKASQLIAKLLMKGVVITLNDFLDDETTIQLLANDFDCEITIDTTEEDRLRITDKTIKQEVQEFPPESLVFRPPVVAFMGHVDHGKTSLIDAIRKSKLAAGEAGEITQHIGAFKCRTDAGDITILDTPGHEAFSAMRARGADVTDIIVLVIAGDEGMRTQTIEAIEQATAANVPILVALNKCDKPNFNAETVYRQLAEQKLLPETWGGQTITVNCSAVTKQGIKELLEMLALQAEVLELKANPNYRARGTVIESQMHKGLGAVATILVQNGTLRLGDALVFAQQFARVKTMHDEHGSELVEAGPSTPVKITGLSDLPVAGSEFIVVKSEKEAMEIAEKRSEGQQHALLQQAKRGAESFLAEKANGVKKKTLNLILRADVQGSVEALKTSLLKIASKKIELNIISSGVGEISESDVQLAQASKATIVGFHTQIESHAESLIKELKVTVKLHDIIYHAVDDIRAVMLSMLDKIPQETDTGEAEVKAIFKASQLGIIAGCTVTDGIIKRSSYLRQVRDKKVIWKGPMHSLKRVKDDVREVSKGYECGIVLQNNNDVKVGDLLQAFEITYLEQEL
jgi:translation initiation factor IF-2